MKKSASSSLRFAFAACALVLAGLGVSDTAPAQQAANANNNVYTIEVIVFRNNSGAGGPEDWSARPVARGPDTPEAQVIGRFVQSLPPAQFYTSCPPSGAGSSRRKAVTPTTLTCAWCPRPTCR